MGSRYKPRRETIDKKIGEVHNKLTILKFNHIGAGNNVYYLCRCECGVEKVICYTNIKYNRTQSCGCLRASLHLKPQEAGKRRLYRKYKQNAKSKKREFDLTYEKFIELTSDSCHYCGAKPSKVIKGKHKDDKPYLYNGVDRRDNARGYTEGNSLSCCAECNYFKNNMAYDVFLCIIRKIYRFKFKEEI